MNNGINIGYYIASAVIMVAILINLFIFKPGMITPDDTLVSYEFYYTEILYTENDKHDHLHKLKYTIQGNINRQCYMLDTAFVALCKTCIKNKIRVVLKKEITGNYTCDCDIDNFEMLIISKMQNTLPYFDIDRLNIIELNKFKSVKDTIILK